ILPAAAMTCAAPMQARTPPRASVSPAYRCLRPTRSRAPRASSCGDGEAARTHSEGDADPAVDDQHVAVDIGACIRGKEDGGTAELVRLRPSADRRALRHPGGEGLV